MSFTIDSTLNQKQALFRSWKSPADPSGGNFTVGIETRVPPEVLLWSGNQPDWRNGPWNGNLFVGVNSVLSIVTNAGKVYFGFSLANQLSGLQHFVVSYDGSLVERSWDIDSRKWVTVWNSRSTECDVYGKCGPFGRCNAVDSPICSCLRGFVPNNNTEWSDGNWSDGCVRSSSLHCDNVGGTSDGFSTLGSMKVPDDAVWSSAGNDDECRIQCLRKCSCLAYAYYSSIGCMMWNASLIDIVQLSDGIGIDLSVRLAYSDISDGTSDTKQGIVVLSGILGGSVVGALLLTAAGVMWRHRRYCDPLSCSVIHYFCFFMLLFGHIKQMSIVLEGMKCARAATTVLNEDQSESDFGDLPIFELHTLVTATNNFEESNKLGKGGFGSVYKGKLEDGVEVAVKRLSKVSGQGLTEFMTEVLVISKLQHRNLVRLLGCCVDGEEKLLVYEYMPNKSLDALLFDRLHQELLDWKTRFNIIQGICRGILYLHRDSRLKIIHRDLKAGNILLDDKLTPKIADFGMARIFVGNEDQADTNRVVGTYGYMSPEYAMEGRFSEKSDIFSLGVLLLEIISGRRNSSFRNEETLSLLAYAWKLWNEDNIVSLIDPTIFELGFQDEILRCTQIALLCLQELPEDRPDMSMVIYMIVDKASILSRPMQPGFTQRRHPPHYQTLEYENMSPSVNRVTLSSIGVR